MPLHNITNGQEWRESKRRKLDGSSEESKLLLKALQDELWKLRAELPELQISLDRSQQDQLEAQKRLDSVELQLKTAPKVKHDKLKQLKEEFDQFQLDRKNQFGKTVQELYESFNSKAQSTLQERQNRFENDKKLLEEQHHRLQVILGELQQQFDEDTELEQKQHHLEQENARLENERRIREAECEAETLAKSICQLVDRLQDVKRDLECTKKQNDSSEKECEGLEAKADRFTKETADVRRDIVQVEEQIRGQQAAQKAAEEEKHRLLEETNHYRSEMEALNEARRRLHEEWQTLKGNIRVFCRIRPDSGPMPAMTDESIRMANRTFQFDRVFGPESTNSEVFQEISQLVQSALDGYNVCIFAYGQTGSGKTFTMSGQNGMIPSSLRQIFASDRRHDDFRLDGQFVEIYGNRIYDLLGDGEGFIKQGAVDNVVTTELTPDNFEQVLENATLNRATASTSANERSSRSHLVFMLTITNGNQQSTLNLVDLAGSERANHVTGARFEETKSINKSLSALGDVVSALKNNQRHIPFRNSKLTHLLQNSLGGHSKTLMFVNVSPNNASETVNSLRFAEKVNGIYM